MMTRQQQAEFYANNLRGANTPVAAPVTDPKAVPVGTYGSMQDMATGTTQASKPVSEAWGATPTAPTPLATQLRAPGTTDWDRLAYGGLAGGTFGGGDNGTPMTEAYYALQPGSYKDYGGTAGKYSSITANPFTGYGTPQYIQGMVYGTGDNGDGSMMGEVLNPEWSQEAYDAAKAEYMKNPTFTADRIKSGAGSDNAYQTAQMKIVTDPDGSQWLVPEGGWTDKRKQSGWSDELENESLWKFLAVVGAGVGGAALAGLGGASAGAGEAFSLGGFGDLALGGAGTEALGGAGYTLGAGGLGTGAGIGEAAAGYFGGAGGLFAGADAAGLGADAAAGAGDAFSLGDAFGPGEYDAYTLGQGGLGTTPGVGDAAAGYFTGMDGLFAGADALGLTSGSGWASTLADLAKKYGPKVIKGLLGGSDGGGGGSGGGSGGSGGGAGGDRTRTSMMLRGSPGGQMIDPNYRKG